MKNLLPKKPGDTTSAEYERYKNELNKIISANLKLRPMMTTSGVAALLYLCLVYASPDCTGNDSVVIPTDAEGAAKHLNEHYGQESKNIKTLCNIIKNKKTKFQRSLDTAKKILEGKKVQIPTTNRNTNTNINTNKQQNTSKTTTKHTPPNRPAPTAPPASSIKAVKRSSLSPRSKVGIKTQHKPQLNIQHHNSTSVSESKAPEPPTRPITAKVPKPPTTPAPNPPKIPKTPATPAPNPPEHPRTGDHKMNPSLQDQIQQGIKLKPTPISNKAKPKDTHSKLMDEIQKGKNLKSAKNRVLKEKKQNKNGLLESLAQKMSERRSSIEGDDDIDNDEWN